MTDADVQVHSWWLVDNKGQPACNPSHCLSNLWIRNGKCAEKYYSRGINTHKEDLSYENSFLIVNLNTTSDKRSAST